MRLILMFMMEYLRRFTMDTRNVKDVPVANTKIAKILSGGYFMGKRKTLQD